MSKLEQLIKELCPNGVEYRELHEILTIKNGSDYKGFGEGDIPVYGSGGIMTYVDTFAYNKPSVLIPRKGSIDKLYYVDTPFWNVDTIFYTDIDTTKATPRYVYHCLLREHLEQYNTAGGVPSLTQKVLNKIKIPVPPIEIQVEIVKILDEYSTSVTALQQELENELTARKKQYEYYRDLLLDFGVRGGGTSECEWRTLESFADVRDGTHDSPKPSDYGYPLVTSKNISGGNLDLTSCYLINENDYNSINQRSKVDITDVLVSMIGTIGETIIVTSEPNYAIKNIGLVKTGNLLTSKYIKYYISSSYGQRYIQENIKGTAPRYLSLTALRRFSIPVPSIEEQERIVSILDRFDKLCNDISEGLPAEIEARRKQYEYYRDKLLSFEERKNA